MMPKITIRQDGAVSEVLVDGKRMSNCVTGLRLDISATCLPEVTLQLVPLVAEIELENAVLRIEDLGLPEAAERALLAQLQAKYEPAAGPRRSRAPAAAAGRGPGPDITAVGRIENGVVTSVNVVNQAADQMDAVRAIATGEFFRRGGPR